MKETKNKILFDSCIIIDAITQRENSSIASKELFLKNAAGQIEGCLLSKQIIDIYYVLRKYIDSSQRKSFISHLLKAFTILPCSKEMLKNALLINGEDYEDNVLIEAAMENKINAICTNNKKHFLNNEKLTILSPEEALNLFNLNVNN